MTILWCGGEDVDFPNGVPPVINTSTSNLNYARCSLDSSGSFSKSVIFSGVPVTSCWLHFVVRTTFPTTGCVIAGLGDCITGKGIFIRTGSSSPYTQANIVKYDGSTYTTLATESGGSITNDIKHKIDLKLTNFGVSSNIILYIDGVLLIDSNVDTSISGISGINSVINVGYTGRYFTSEFIVADEDTRLMSLVTYYPNATGDTDDWDGAYTDIDETTLSDADTIYTTVADEDFQCNLIATPAGNFVCKAVKTAYRCAKAVTTGKNIQTGIKTNGTLYLSDTKTLDTVWGTVEDLYQVNPATSQPFTIAELDALQMAVRAKV